MKLLFITVSYFPDIGPNARIVREIVQDLAAAGDEVTILCGMPHHPTLEIPTAYRGKLFVDETIDGLAVLRTWLFAKPGKGALGKILSYTSFMVLAVLGGLRLWLRRNRFDFIFVISPPLLEGISGWALSRVFRTPYLFNVQDIYPDVAVDHGLITSRPLVRALSWAERFIYRHSAAVSVISEGFRQNLLGKGVPADKIVIVPNWVNSEFYTPGDRLTDFRRENGLAPEHFVVNFAGTIGYSQGLEFLLEAAERLRDHPEIRFLIVGAGADKQNLVDAAARAGLGNVVFHDPVPQARMPEVLATADACLVSLRGGKSTTTITCKTYEIMSCGRPVLGAVDADGDNWQLIDSAGAGLHVTPEDPDSLAAAIMRLYEDRALAGRLGHAGRTHVVEHYRRAHWTLFYHDLFEKIIARRKGRDT